MGGYGGFRGNWCDPRVRKLKMPIFEGEDAHGWIYKVERYFAVNGLTEEERLTAAGLCLEGKACSWYQWRDMRRPIRSWREFKDCLVERFRTGRGGDFYEQFFALTQEGSVTEYRERFEYLASRLDRLPETVLEGNFMKGLTPEIRAAVRVMRPRDLGEAMELAQLVEDQRRLEKLVEGSSSRGTYRMATTFLTPKEPTPGTFRETPKEKTAGGRPGDNFKKLTETELHEKRAKGIYFRCDERYTPGHRCKDRTLQYHAGYQEQMSRWPEQPINIIIKWLKSRSSSLVVADFGCGNASLARTIENKVFSIDLVSTDPSVIACDMSKTPLESKSVDVAVFCLSLMGINYHSYLKEANRVLKPCGWLLIAEVRSRFDPNNGGADPDKFSEAVKQLGFTLSSKDFTNKMFVLFYFKKREGAASMHKAIDWPELKPCLYKRR
ncbi:hypothetical protein IEQ34_026990 [Dendrobium chrysotoxum]|uniref:Ribosomal RNA-processing protein 8 n=1 Tax=Dendrobium chrysotoxum TaxID=161865 RepID=A0AAV7FID9_DENCH|nr:hypothetical protein IEQ34_026990 [Dendrobium chrysotoxum]